METNQQDQAERGQEANAADEPQYYQRRRQQVEHMRLLLEYFAWALQDLRRPNADSRNFVARLIGRAAYYKELRVWQELMLRFPGISSFDAMTSMTHRWIYRAVAEYLRQVLFGEFMSRGRGIQVAGMIMIARWISDRAVAEYLEQVSTGAMLLTWVGRRDRGGQADRGGGQGHRRDQPGNNGAAGQKPRDSARDAAHQG